jgi:hypothetical protein
MRHGDRSRVWVCIRAASIGVCAGCTFRPPSKRRRFGARENRLTFREAQRDDDPA